MTRPKLVSAFGSGFTVAVTFDQPMDSPALPPNVLADPASYSIPGLPVVSVLVSNPSTPNVLLTLAREMRTGSSYSLTVDPALRSFAGGEYMDPAFRTAVMAGAGVAPAITSAVATAMNVVRANFSEPMRRDAVLLNPASYSVASVGVGVAVVVTAVRAPNTPELGHVDLIVTEMTDGAEYEVDFAASPPDTPADVAGNYGSPGAPAPFNGVGQSPSVLRMRATSANEVEVGFDRPMLDNPSIRDVSKYAFSGGLVATRVAHVGKDVVVVETSAQAPGDVYNVVVSP